MEKNVRFYHCPICKTTIGLIHGDMEHMTCCGKKLEELVPNTVDASIEKHTPVYEKVDNKILVKVGEVEHPMDEDHYIMWVAQVTDNTTTRVRLLPGEKIEIEFPYIPGALLYAYCNKHGLWETIVE